MAKRKAPSANGAKKTKAQSVRDAIKELGKKAKARDIADHLAKKGETVNMTQIYGILAAGKKRRNGKRKKAAAVAPAAPAMPKDAFSLEHLIAAKQLVVHVGGVKQAQLAIAAVAKIG